MSKSPEEFNPANPEYVKVEDLPEEHRSEFINVSQEMERGFVRKEAKEVYDDCKKLGYSDEEIFKQLHEKALWQEKNDKYLKQEAINIIQKNGVDGLQEVAKRFGGGGGDALHAAEGLIKKFYKEGGGEYSDLIDAIADILNSLKNRSFTEWSHSICHLFEEYGGDHEMPGFSSLLDSPDNLKAAGKLINEGVHQSIEKNQIGCMDRMLSPLPRYNLDNLDPALAENKFVFKPDSVSQSEFVKIIEEEITESSGDYVKYLKVFLTSETPKDFIISLVKKKIKLPLSKSKQEMVIDLLKPLEDKMSTEDIDAYINQCYKVNEQKTTFDELAKNIVEAKDAHDVVMGTYIDVEGTLIKNNKLDENLVWRLKKYYVDKQVIVFTGGSPEIATERLRSLGFPEEFLPVKSKADFKGKVLEEVIDDTPPEFQGFKAIKCSRG